MAKRIEYQIGVKKLYEIERLIDNNCWRATIWIHALLLRQLQILFYYHNQYKELGIKRVNINLDLTNNATIRLEDVNEHNEKIKKLMKKLNFFGTALEFCNIRCLIDEEVKDLREFNTFRNNELIHIDLNKYLPRDDVVKKNCKLGLELIKKLDTKLMKVFKDRWIKKEDE